MKFKKQNKYRNVKCEAVDGEKFDSMKERERYYQLLMMEKAGIITELRRQYKFCLLPKQEGERAAYYIADFVYEDKETGLLVVEDVKGHRTADYRLKKKMMLYFFGIKIREIE